MSGRRTAVTVGLVSIAVVLVAVVAGASRPSPRPLDPASTRPDGTKALVLLLGALGATVHLDAGPPATSAGVGLLLSDQLNAGERDAVRSWIESGGTLVVNDPQSDLTGAALFRQSSQLVTGETVNGPLSRGCAVAALGGVGVIDPAGGVLFRPGPADTACFSAGGGAFVLVRALGRGTVVDIGGAGIFVNANLGRLDNSVLAAALLAPSPGTTVNFLGPVGQVGAGRKHLLDLISGRLKEGFWQLVLAFALLALWRARRHGRPVPETLPVELPGSDLVVAVGNLFQQARRRDQAARILRGQLRARLADRLGLPQEASPEMVADAAEARTGVRRDRILGALIGSPPEDEGGLVVLAQTTEAIHQEVTRVR